MLFMLSYSVSIGLYNLLTFCVPAQNLCTLTELLGVNMIKLVFKKVYGGCYCQLPCSYMLSEILVF